VATRIWTGGATSTPQVDSLTPASVGIGNSFSAVINGKTVTFVATAATVANVTAGLSAAMAASTEPEFRQVTAVDNTTNILVTGPDTGTPFTLTASASGGTATLTRAAVTAPVSPNDWATAANWTGAAVPVTGDAVIFDGTSTVDCLYGLDQNAVTLASLAVANAYTGNLGLPARNDAGYSEYRETYLKIGVTAVTIGGGGGGGSGRVKLNTGTVQTSIAVLSTGTGSGGEPAAFLFKGTHASNAVNVGAGSVGLAALAGEVATVLTLRVGAGTGGGTPNVVGGAGLTLTTLIQDGGDVTLNAGLTTATLIDGTLAVFAGNVTTANVDGGTFYYEGVGTITTLNISAGGTADFTRDPRPRTVTTCTIQSNAKMVNTFMTAAFTNPVVLNRCATKDCDLDFGTHLSLTVAPGP
jgi:trimeric autotransporter adhesin